MQIVASDGDHFLLRFDRDDEVITGLQGWCVRQGITAAEFSAIGACREVVLSYFDGASKSYRDQKIVAQLEICSLQGNIAARDGAPFVHAHGTFADEHLRVRGGHVKAVVVSVTCEVVVRPLGGNVRREFDDATGLALLAGT